MATKSIGTTGRDYATLALWAAYVNALSLSAPEVGECYNDSEFTEAAFAGLTLGGWTGDSGTNTVTLKCASGQSFRDNASVQSNALRYNQANGVGYKSNASFVSAVNVTGGHFILDGLQIKGYENLNTTTSLIRLVSAGGTATIRNCILQGYVSGVNAIILYPQNGDIIQNVAVILTGTLGSGIYCDGGPAGTDITIVSTDGTSGTGVLSGGANTVLKNCAVAGFGANDYAGTASASCTNNATDQASFGGTNFGGSGQVSLVATTEWESVTSGSEDLRVKSTSAKLKDNGATVGPTNDIAGTSRPQGSAYDIGCWELVVSASQTVGEMMASRLYDGIVRRRVTDVIAY